MIQVLCDPLPCRCGLLAWFSEHNGIDVRVHTAALMCMHVFCGVCVVVPTAAASLGTKALHTGTGQASERHADGDTCVLQVTYMAALSALGGVLRKPALYDSADAHAPVLLQRARLVLSAAVDMWAAR